MYHYVYKLTHTITGQYYFGSRSCKCKPFDDNYLGSNVTWKIKKEDKKKYLIKEILKSDFLSREDAILYEAELIRAHINDSLNENYHIPPNKFKGNTKNKVVVKDSDGNTFQVSINDPRYLNKELIPLNCGMIVTRDNLGNTFRVSTNDPRYLSGDLIPACKDKITVKDKDNNHFMISKNDPRYLSGELVHMRNGISPINKGTSPILQIKDGEIIKEWANLCELHNVMGYKKSTILGWIYHGKNAKNGFLWKYKK